MILAVPQKDKDYGHIQQFKDEHRANHLLRAIMQELPVRYVIVNSCMDITIEL